MSMPNKFFLEYAHTGTGGVHCVILEFMMDEKDHVWMQDGCYRLRVAQDCGSTLRPVIEAPRPKDCMVLESRNFDNILAVNDIVDVPEGEVRAAIDKAFGLA